MKKYIIAGGIGFLVHAIWMIGGAYIYTIELSENSFLNILKFYYDAVEKSSNDVAIFLYPLFFAVIFAVVVRIVIMRVGYNKNEMRWVSMAAGIGFFLAFCAIFIVLWNMVSGFGF